MTRRSGRPQHLSLGRSSAVMGMVLPVRLLHPLPGPSLVEVSTGGSTGRDLGGAPTGLGAPFASSHCWQVPQQSRPRIVDEDGAEALIATKSCLI